MKTIKGPAIFLAQFIGDKPPFDTLDNLGRWVAGLGYKGVQIPTNLPAIFDLAEAARSRTYCDEVKGRLSQIGLAITELSTHIQGQLVAVHPAYDALFDGFAPEPLRGRPAERQAWAVDQLRLAAKASQNLGLSAHATFPAPLPGLISILGRNARRDLLTRPSTNWRGAGSRSSMLSTRPASTSASKFIPAKICTMAITYEMFLERSWAIRAPTCSTIPTLVLQQIDYLEFIDMYHERIRCFM